MKKNTFGCNVYINTGIDEPAIITQLTGIIYTELHTKGEQKRFNNGILNPNIVYENNIWIYKSDKYYQEDNFFVGDSIVELLKVFDVSNLSISKNLPKFKSKKIVCYGYFYEYNPYMYISKETINKISTLDFDIEFDFYYLAEDER